MTFGVENLGQDFLKKEFGMKTGDMLWSYARGIDVREVHTAQVILHTCLQSPS